MKEIKRLQSELAAALAAQDYEQAAALKTQIERYNATADVPVPGGRRSAASPASSLPNVFITLDGGGAVRMECLRWFRAYLCGGGEVGGMQDSNCKHGARQSCAALKGKRLQYGGLQ